MKYEESIKRACVKELGDVFGFKPFLKNVSVIDIIFVECVENHECLVRLEVSNFTAVHCFKINYNNGEYNARYVTSSGLDKAHYRNFVTCMMYEKCYRFVYYNRIKHFVDSVDYTYLVNTGVHTLYKEMKMEFDREIFEQYGETDESLNEEFIRDECYGNLYDYSREERPFVKEFISCALKDNIYVALGHIGIKNNINYLFLRPCDESREEFKITMFIERGGRYFCSSMYNDEYGEIGTYEFQDYHSYIMEVHREYERWNTAEKIKTIEVSDNNLEIVFKED